MKKYLKLLFKERSTSRWIASGLYNSPFLFIFSFFRSLILTKKLTGRFYPILVRVNAGQKFRIRKGRNVTTMLRGVLTVNSWNGSNLPASLSLGEGCKFILEGDFIIGPNVHVSLSPSAILTIKGTRISSGSGVTCDAKIMVEKQLTIGSDCILAWDCFLTDSDWHAIGGTVRTEPVTIGDNVWISHGVSILKGSSIGSGSIVGARSVVNSRFEHKNALIAGNPARVCRQGVRWER